MVRWSRRHWLWLAALVPGAGLAWLAWTEWVETGRRYRKPEGGRTVGCVWRVLP